MNKTELQIQLQRIWLVRSQEPMLALKMCISLWRVEMLIRSKNRYNRRWKKAMLKHMELDAAIKEYFGQYLPGELDG